LAPAHSQFDGIARRHAPRRYASIWGPPEGAAGGGSGAKAGGKAKGAAKKKES
jgi:hypothetical protein